MIKRIGFVALSFVAITFISITSCKKVLNHPDDGGDTTSLPNATLISILDSVYMYAHQVYFWNNNLPSYSEFNPEQYAKGSQPDSIKLLNELFAITVSYNSAINSKTGRSYEFYADDSTDLGDFAGPKYSYFEETSSNDKTSSIVNSSDFLGGTDYGLGFYPGIWNSDSLLVRYVEQGSPFDNAGIKRGDRILKINSTNMNFDNAHANASIKVINTLLDKGTVAAADFEIERVRNGMRDTITKNINPSLFTFNPVFKDTILTASDGKKVGYIAYQSFTNWEKSSQTPLQNAFEKFSNSSISDLIVDLRYNGGGFVETSDNFANLIAPMSADGKTMSIEYYNDTMQAGKAFLLNNQLDNTNGIGANAHYWSTSYNTSKFKKAGNLSDLPRVIFLVSNNTASAAELLMNNLKPYMKVVLIGTQWEEGSGDVTYGKPVGFFPITVNKYDYYIPEFATGNATDPVGGATYYNGISVDNASSDDARYDFGNPKETALAQALYYIVKGTYSNNYNKGYFSNVRDLKSINLKRRFKQSSYFSGMMHSNVKKRF